MRFQYLHMPKTGGQSIMQYAKNNNIDMICQGHICFEKCRINKGRILIATLRCPIKHVMSIYTCNLRGGIEKDKSSLRWLARNHEFSEWLRHPMGPVMKDYRGEFNVFSYCSFYGRRNGVSKAISNLKLVNHVLDTSHLTQQFNSNISSKYGLPTFSIKKNASKPIQIGDEDIDFIKKHRAHDFEICRAFGIETSV